MSTSTDRPIESGTTTVRALVAHGAGDLRLDERPAPAVPQGFAAVRIGYGGICGSDLHYWRHGRVGDFRLTEPLTLGHEVVGTLMTPAAQGPRTLEPGSPVAVHPATPCGVCPECRSGRRNVCRDTRYLGSAARTPHVQGGLVDVLVVPVDQVVPLPDGLDLLAAAVVEPASVAWHAAHRAGDVAGRHVLVTGAGPIGALVVAALRARGAAVVTVTDVVPAALDRVRVLAATGRRSGPSASQRVRPTTSPGWTPSGVDAAVESSGSPAGLGTCVRAARRGARVVGLGLLPPGEVPVAGNLVVTRELELVGSFRFDGELTEVLEALASGRLATDGVVTHVLPFEQAASAFELAGDPARSGKVLLDLTAGGVPA